MLIKFLSNSVEQHVENSVGRALIAGSLAVEVKPPAPAPPTPVWSVRRDTSGFVFIEMKLGTMGPGATSPTAPRFVATYQGDPDKIHDRKNSAGRYSSAFGRPVPKEIVEEYKRARRNPDVVRPDHSKITDDYNKDHAETLAAMNRQAFKPVVAEHEALDAQANKEANKNLPVLVTPANKDGRFQPAYFLKDE